MKFKIFWLLTVILYIGCISPEDWRAYQAERAAAMEKYNSDLINRITSWEVVYVLETTADGMQIEYKTPTGTFKKMVDSQNWNIAFNIPSGGFMPECSATGVWNIGRVKQSAMIIGKLYVNGKLYNEKTETDEVYGAPHVSLYTGDWVRSVGSKKY